MASMDSICTLFDGYSSKEFIDSLNQYGKCIDYSNEYERHKTKQGIFVGVVKKVYEVPNGANRHSEQSCLFILVKSLITNPRESQAFRVGFIGDIIKQLLNANLKKGDHIGILKPTFFYALDVPTLFAGNCNVIVWIGKNVKESQEHAETGLFQESQSNDEWPIQRRIAHIRRNSISSNEDTDSYSSVSLQCNAQIRSKAVELNLAHTSKGLCNNKLIPDSTTSISKKSGAENVYRKKYAQEIELVRNFNSQNTAVDGSAIATRKEKQNKQFVINSPSKCSHRTCIRSNTVSHGMSCRVHNTCSNICCIHQRIPNNCAFSSCSCDIGCHSDPACSCRSVNHRCHTVPQCCCKNLSSKLVNSCFCKTYNQRCTSIPMCSNNFNGACFQPHHVPACQSNYMTSSHCIHNQVIAKHCCDYNHTQNLQPTGSTQCRPTPNNNNSHHNCQEDCSMTNSGKTYEYPKTVAPDGVQTYQRTTEWVFSLPRKSPSTESLETDTSSVSLLNRVSEPTTIIKANTKNNKQVLVQREQSQVDHKQDKGDNKVKNKANEHIVQKKKLFSPQFNSSIISVRSVYNHSTIVEESTPFCTESTNKNDSNPKNHECDSNNDDLTSGSKSNVCHENENNSVSITGCTAQITYEKNQINENEDIQKIAEPEVVNISSRNSEDSFSNSVAVNLHNASVHTSSEDGILELRIDLPLTETTCNGLQNSRQIIETLLIDKESTYEKNEKNLINEDDDIQKIAEPPVCNNSRNSEDTIVNNGTMNFHNMSVHKTPSEDGILELRTDLPITATTCSGLQNSRQIIETSSISKESTTDKTCDKVSHSNQNDGEIILEKESSASSSTKDLLGGSNSNQLVPHSPKSIDPITKPENNDQTKSADKSTVLSLSLSLSDYSKNKDNKEDTKKILEIDVNPNFYKSSAVDSVRDASPSSDEAGEDLMELTCESILTKKRKKSEMKVEQFKKKKSELTKSKENLSAVVTPSSGTFSDARSDFSSYPSTSEKWCLKSVDDVFGQEKNVSQLGVLKKNGLMNNCSYDLKLLSTFEVVGLILNTVPHLSDENFGEIIRGFCNDGCRKEYCYYDYRDMENIDDGCTSCRFRFHMICPGCHEKGLKRYLCLYYSFEIHLLDGENVLRILVEQQNGIDFFGCTPQLYLRSKKVFKKLKKLIVNSSPDNWKNVIVLKAKIKVMPKLGVPTLTLHQGTSLKKDLRLNGKPYIF